MGFLLKKFVGALLMPLPFAVTLIFAGTILTLLRRLPRVRRWLVIAGVAWLVVLSNDWVADQLVRPIESQFPAIPELPAGAPVPAALAACRYVAVLGSGNADVAGFSATNELGLEGLARIVEGVRILRVLPEAKLIVSGPGSPGHATHASVLEQAAISLGVAPDRIVRIDTAHDTEEEAGAILGLVGSAQVALVTSAWHMPRAMALARHVGLQALACPANFTAPPRSADDWGEWMNWGPGALQRSTWAVRERIGYLWIWLRGRTRPAAG
jgi:uncharacterized SAM-binding protein YcdF (DUF218 family)